MTTEIVMRGVRPEPLPSQRKPWAKAGIHLLALYAIFGGVLLWQSNDMYGGMAEGRVRMDEAGLLPYLEGQEVVDPVTSEVTEIGPLNYDLMVALEEDFFLSYSVDERRTICETFQANPDGVWQNLVQTSGTPDTVENRLTFDKVYQERCETAGFI